jgi:CubicO group peptidase (beta-lactamase class C family)
MISFKLYLCLCLCPFYTHAFNWPVSTPENEGVDSTKISQGIDLIHTGDYGDIRSLIVIKNGKLISENYFNNTGEKAPVYSVTKSIGSILLGIAKYQGYEFEITQSMMSYMPQYADINDFDNKQNISLQHLLSQRHGLDWDELTLPYEQIGNPVTTMLATNDWYRTVLEWPTSHQANQKFAYSTGASSLMSVVLKTITNQTPQNFSQSQLFEPLDIVPQNTHWEIVGANGSNGTGISTFPMGLAPLGFGLWLKPIDLAKLGQLYLNKGLWQGNRILSESWIDQSTFPYSNGVTDPDFFGSSNTGYGHQWWTTVFKDINNRTYHSYYADGFGRQFIFVFPEIDLVVVSTARDFTYDGIGIGALLRNFILPSMSSVPQNHLLIDKNIDGAWYWPENTGQGFTFEFLEQSNEVLGFWYTYEQATQKQRWFIMQGPITDNKAQLTIRTTLGGDFVNSAPPTMIDWGTADLFIDECHKVTFQFTSEQDAVSGEIPLSQLTGGEDCSTNKTMIRNNNKIFVH